MTSTPEMGPVRLDSPVLRRVRAIGHVFRHAVDRFGQRGALEDLERELAMHGGAQTVVALYQPGTAPPRLAIVCVRSIERWWVAGPSGIKPATPADLKISVVEEGSVVLETAEVIAAHVPALIPQAASPLHVAVLDAARRSMA